VSVSLSALPGVCTDRLLLNRPHACGVAKEVVDSESHTIITVATSDWKIWPVVMTRGGSLPLANKKASFTC
jgi:hypothetical protein